MSVVVMPSSVKSEDSISSTSSNSMGGVTKRDPTEEGEFSLAQYIELIWIAASQGHPAQGIQWGVSRECHTATNPATEAALVT